MTQHGEEPAVVRGLSRRITRTLRSAATVALTAGIALTVASASALPIASPSHSEPPAASHCRFVAARDAASTATTKDARRHSRKRPRDDAPVTGTPAAKYSSATDIAFHAAGVGTAAPASAVRRVSLAIATPAAQILRFGTKASRTRGQPEVA